MLQQLDEEGCSRVSRLLRSMPQANILVVGQADSYVMKVCYFLESFVLQSQIKQTTRPDDTCELQPVHCHQSSICSYFLYRTSTRQDSADIHARVFLCCSNLIFGTKGKCGFQVFDEVDTVVKEKGAARLEVM